METVEQTYPEEGTEAAGATPQYCAVPPQPIPDLAPDLAPDRAAAILVGRTKWANGTVLHYYFFDNPATDRSQVRLANGTTRVVSWVGGEDQQESVRRAFKTWKDLGIGLELVEVDSRDEAEVRIGFMAGDGSWSHIGRNVLAQSVNNRTMNFGWDVTSPYGRTTALHEIGHTLGMPHEHQNPFAGIVWDEEKVYANLAGPPNRWPRETTFHNILRKLNPNEVEGSSWDPDSIMEYAFDAGLIKEPAQYRAGISPPGTISPADKSWALKWYPGIEAAPPRLTAFQSVPLSLGPGQQADFSIAPVATRSYDIGTFGSADTVIVLFEEVNGQLRYVAGDDDSGVDRNARLRAKLFQGRKYVLRVRLYWASQSGQTAVMYW